MIGGYANDTALAGCPTLDLLVQLDDHLRPSVQPKVANARSAADRLIDLFCARYGSVEVDANGWISVRTDRRLPLSVPRRPSVSVRLLPSFRCEGGGVLIAAPAREATARRWRQLDIDAQSVRINEIDRLSHGKARHLIRMIKAWRDAADVPLCGFAVELLVIDFLSVWIYRRRSLLFYDWMVRDFFFWVAAQAGRNMPIPGTIEVLPIGDGWVAKAERAYLTAAAAAELERDNHSLAALAHWREIFGLRFLGEEDSSRQPAAREELLIPG
ncbi:MAG: hypothetical protein HC834_05660 [Rhodospirillales bacterium]|nr:hypothetical protein [Rhodospirillales bacterium]